MSKAVYTYRLDAAIDQGLVDRVNALGAFDLKSADGKFLLATSDGKKRLSGMLGAFKLRVVLTPDDQGFTTALDAILSGIG